MSRVRNTPEPLSLIERIFPWVGALIVVTAVPVSDDPVNVWKLLVLTVFSAVLLSLLLNESYRKYLGNRLSQTLIGAFFISMLIPLIFSGAPLIQQIYGVSGRLTGLIALLSFGVLFLIASSGFQKDTYRRVLTGLILAGSYNLVLNLFENLGINLLQFDNTYKVPLGSLGNPNFMSAFLAIFFVVGLTVSLDPTRPMWVRILTLLQLLLALFELTKVGSNQGFYVVVAGTAVVVYLKIRIYLPRFVRYFLQLIMVGSGFLVALGFLEKGPLSALVYKQTAQYRYEYWRAGISMATDNLFTGVGLNSYGDWFRQYRSAESISSPGKDVSTNVSHNVFIDYFATGGLIHFVSYLSITFLVIRSARHFLRNSNGFDPLFAGLLGGWVSYQLQALISVDNLALAVWSWVLGGSIVGYARITANQHASVLSDSGSVKGSGKKASPRNSVNSALQTVQIFSAIFIATLIVTPVLKASIDWRNAILSRQVEKIVIAGKQWPNDETRLAKSIALLMNNQQNKIALDLTLSELYKYPRSVTLRYYLINNPEASEVSKVKTKKENLVLDPLNPDWKS